MLRASSLGLRYTRPRLTVVSLSLPWSTSGIGPFSRKSTRSTHAGLKPNLVARLAPSGQDVGADGSMDFGEEDTMSIGEEEMNVAEKQMGKIEDTVDDRTGEQEQKMAAQYAVTVKVRPLPSVRRDAPLRTNVPGSTRLSSQDSISHPSSNAPVDPEEGGSISPSLPENAELRLELLDTIGMTTSVEEAWDAYYILLSMPRDPHLAKEESTITYAHLHRLARLLAGKKPRTRTLFLRFRSVLSTLRESGGQIQLWEWNALIDCAGKGWRKTRLHDFNTSLQVFEDMMRQNSLGAEGYDEAPFQFVDEDRVLAGRSVHPDITTYTTLVNIAARTLIPSALQNAVSLLNSSGLQPNRITHLSMLRFYTRRGDLAGVRSTLIRLKEQGFELRLDGLNAVIWAYARNNRLDIAWTIYRILRFNLSFLRHRLNDDPGVADKDVQTAVQYLSEKESIVVGDDLIPDHITYHILIQSFAYRGDLMTALQVFADMLSTPIIVRAEKGGDRGASQAQKYPATLAAYRSLFLGFFRHGQPPEKPRPDPVIPTDPAIPLTMRLKAAQAAAQAARVPRAHVAPRSLWNLENFNQIVASFLELPRDSKPNDRTIFWLIIALGKTSGNDLRRMRGAWMDVARRFRRTFWTGRLAKLRGHLFKNEHGIERNK